MLPRTAEDIAGDEQQLKVKHRFGEGAHNVPAEKGGYTRFVHSVCGYNTILPAERVGCGEPMHTCAEVYRCTDCGTPFHRSCAVKHFGIAHGRFDSEVKVSDTNPSAPG
jgi:hypothetical protein